MPSLLSPMVATMENPSQVPSQKKGASLIRLSDADADFDADLPMVSALDVDIYCLNVVHPQTERSDQGVCAHVSDGCPVWYQVNHKATTLYLTFTFTFSLKLNRH